MQVLFDPAEYDLLEAVAREERRSVGSLIRESVRQRVSRPRADRQAALNRLLARADAGPAVPVGNWEDVKAGFERETLAGIA